MVAFAPQAQQEVLTRVQARPITPIPSMYRVHSEPVLRRSDLPEEAASKTLRHDYRRGLTELLNGFDGQCAARKREHKEAAEVEKAKEMMRMQYQRSLDSSRQPERPEWTYCDYAGFFEKPLLYEQGPSIQHVKNGLIQGIFNVKGLAPAHSECNVFGVWNNFRANERGLELAEFGTKLPHRMGPTEKMFADRLDRAVKRAEALVKDDALKATSGAWKKRQIESYSAPWSSLKKTKPAWKDQAVYTHEYFAHYPPYAPGDHPYETSMDEYIVQSERAHDFSREIIIGDHERTSFWRPRVSASPSGTTRRLDKAQALLCPPGVRKVRLAESRASLKRSASGPLPRQQTIQAA